MKSDDLMRIEEVLSGIANNSLACPGWIYLSKDRNWNLDSQCAILESVEVPPELEDDSDAGVPAFAKENGLMQVLPFTVVQDVVTNVKMQNPSTWQGYWKHFFFIITMMHLLT
jgi:hypothetical protein